MGTWQKYIDYLMDWAREHAHPDFQGMSPACYDEWLENEGEEGYNGEILTNEEFQRRCEKVFIANKNDVFYDIYIIENQVCILIRYLLYTNRICLCAHKRWIICSGDEKISMIKKGGK